MTTLLVPVKALDNAKSRLSGRLSTLQRRTLCMDMLEHVLQQGTATKGLKRLVLLTPCPRIRQWARRVQLEVIGDPPAAEGLAAVIDHGISRIRSSAECPVLVLMGDLPRLSTEELERMVKALDTADVVLAPDAAETGTNALGLAPNVPLPTCFGRVDSFQAHHARCRSLGYRVADVRAAGLAFDLDTVRDLDTYLRGTSRALVTS